MNNLLEAAVQSFRGWNILPKERISSADIPGTSSAGFGPTFCPPQDASAVEPAWPPCAVVRSAGRVEDEACLKRDG